MAAPLKHADSNPGNVRRPLCDKPSGIYCTGMADNFPVETVTPMGDFVQDSTTNQCIPSQLSH